ncbi:hypothetical protein ACFW6E_45905 [Streptomyces olivaceoviridis]|uniref:hypothetical protein n=1 Tax=Streptomyces olivaceoviridis TaxID=1921 RepID=UPI0036A52E41
MLDAHPAVRALDCLLDYAASRALRDGQMPGDVLNLVAGVLAARGGDEAVAAVIGARLPFLHRRATAFTAAHHDEVYGLVPGRPSPAAAWLHDRRGPGLDPLLLAALDGGQLLAALREEPSGRAAFCVVHALLTGHDELLGDPVATWRALAAGPGGAETASAFLGYLALFTAMRPVDRTAVDTEQVWWTAALDAGLPPGALADAGYFAAALPDEVWLPLARRSAAHSPAQKDAGWVAEHAAAHPRESDALLGRGFTARSGYTTALQARHTVVCHGDRLDRRLDVLTRVLLGKDPDRWRARSVAGRRWPATASCETPCRRTMTCPYRCREGSPIAKAGERRERVLSAFGRRLRRCRSGGVRPRPVTVPAIPG